MNTDRKTASQIYAILFFGGLWGLLEGTLGFLLHFLPRVTPFPRLAGFIMFPVGLIFMLGAVKVTRKPWTVFAVAAVAAGVKLASLALPVVRWQFVQTPALAILAESCVVFLTLYLSDYNRVSAKSAAAAFSASIGWRVLFLFVSLIFGLRGGILARPASALLQFIFLEGAVNGALILALIAAGTFRIDEHSPITAFALKPFPVGAALFLAFTAEFATAYL